MLLHIYHVTTGKLKQNAGIGRNLAEWQLALENGRSNATGTRILHSLMASIFEHFHWQLPSTDFTILHSDTKLIMTLKKWAIFIFVIRDISRNSHFRNLIFHKSHIFQTF